jgi:hypothetical protein
MNINGFDGSRIQEELVSWQLLRCQGWSIYEVFRTGSALLTCRGGTYRQRSSRHWAILFFRQADRRLFHYARAINGSIMYKLRPRCVNRYDVVNTKPELVLIRQARAPPSNSYSQPWQGADGQASKRASSPQSRHVHSHSHSHSI